MRIGAVYEWNANANYRLLQPLEQLRARGHEVVHATSGSSAGTARTDMRKLRGCDVVWSYRFLEGPQFDAIKELVRRGAAFVWDTDDDLGQIPRESPHYRRTGGVNALQTFRNTVTIARLTQVMTTSTEPLAQRYREQGIERVEVLENYLSRDRARARRRRHDGIVVGWMAGLEHAAELPRVPIVDALTRLLDAHPQLRVVSIGVDLRLRSDRYTRHPEVDFVRLQDHIGGWDIAIAPLADIPFNRTRSNVKLKEYAGAGAPWLASPIGPYAGLGEEQGGRLVADDGWFEAIDDLVRHRFARGRLGRKARAWAKTQTIDAVAGRWEAVLEEAVEIRRAAGR